MDEEQATEEAMKKVSNRVITVRLSPAMHLALKKEAHDRRLSMNALAVEKLFTGKQASR